MNRVRLLLPTCCLLGLLLLVAAPRLRAQAPLLRAADFRFTDTTQLVLGDTADFTVSIYNDDSLVPYTNVVKLFAYINTPATTFLLDSLVGISIQPSAFISHSGRIFLDAQRWRFGDNVIVIWPDATAGGGGTSNDSNRVLVRVQSTASIGADRQTLPQLWSLYPNPARHQALIYTQFDVQNIALYAPDGRLVGQHSHTVPAGATVLLPTAHLPAGLYSVQMTTAQGQTLPAKWLLWQPQD